MERATPIPTLPPRSGAGRVVWTWVGLILAAGIVLSLALSTVGSLADQAIPSRQRVFTTPVQAVTVEVGRGSVTVERSAGPDTVVETSGTRGLTSPSDLERVSGRTLTIRSSCGWTFSNNRCSRDYVLKVPPSATLHINTGQGNVGVVGVDGALAVNSGEGDVTVRDGTGPLRATSGQGSVSADGLRSQDVYAESGQGDVDLGFLAPPRRVAANSGQGSVSIELPKGPDTYQIHDSSSEGTTTSTVNESSSSPRIIHATSGQGDVTVRYRAG